MRPIVCLTLLLSVAPIALSAERYFDPLPSDNYEIIYDDGVAIATARGDSAVVAISYLPSDSKSSWAAISVRNISHQPFNVGESSITGTSNGQALKVARYEDLLKRQQRSEFWDALGAGANAYTNNQNAARAARSETTSTYYESTDARAQGAGGYATATAETIGTATSTTSGGSAAVDAKQRADEENARIIAQMNQMHDSQRVSLDRKALRMRTIQPGEYTSGQVLIYLPRKSKRSPAKVELVLKAGTEQFVFTFQER